MTCCRTVQRISTIVTALVLLVATAGLAKVLTLSEAEHAAVTIGFKTRAEHFEERAREWEKWNAVAAYLPTVDYSLTYLRMDEQTVNAMQRAIGGISDMMAPYAEDIGRNMARLDTLESLTGFPTSIPDTAYNLLSPPASQQQSDAEQANSPFAMFERSWKHEFQINQPITNGGMEIMAIGIARHTKKAIELQTEIARQQAIYDARKAYFEALAARERMLVAEQTLVWNTRNLQKARVRYETGAIPITDVLQWEADVARKTGEEAEARAVQRLMLLTLYQAMGTPLGRADTGVDLQPLEFYEAWYGEGPAPTQASIEDNLTLRMVQEYADVARRTKGIALGQMMPQVNAFVNYGWPDWKEFLPPDESRSWSAGFVATVHLFQGFKGVTNLRMKKYEYLKTLVGQQETANQLAVNLDRIAAFYRASRSKVEATRRQWELMQKQLEVMQQRYDAGLVNQSQLLEVELGARQTRIGYIQALFDCLLLEAEYQQNTGQLEVSQ